MSDLPADGKVGYRKPPTHTRFQPGKSGNPRGREKGLRKFAAEVKRALERPVTLTDQGRSKRVSTQEALVFRLREKALKGDPRSLDKLLELAKTHNSEASEFSGGNDISAGDQAILDAYLEAAQSSKPTGDQVAREVSACERGPSDE